MFNQEETRMKDFLYEYFNAKGGSHIADDYSAFCDWIHDEREFSEKITSGVLTNLDFKKSLAKKIVSDMMNERDYYHEQEIMDHRLRALITYYFSINLYSQDAKNVESAVNAYRKYHFLEDRGHVSGKYIDDNTGKAVASMRPGDFLYRGYRFFIINMLCFTSSRFVVGMRTDSGPVRGSMKYYKGCRPLGIRKADNGIEWNLIECDYFLSDDHFAIISNTLDGDGTIEICDWLNNKIQRVIFRCNY